MPTAPKPRRTMELGSGVNTLVWAEKLTLEPEPIVISSNSSIAKGAFSEVITTEADTPGIRGAVVSFAARLPTAGSGFVSATFAVRKLLPESAQLLMDKRLEGLPVVTVPLRLVVSNSFGGVVGLVNPVVPNA